MITPQSMLAIKNPTAVLAPFFALLLLLSGCVPPGPKALLRGQELLEKGDYSGAVASLKTATSLLPTNAHAWNYLGLAYHHAGLPTDAQQSYQRALKLDKDLIEARYNIGCLWLEQNQLDWAKNELTAYTLRRQYDPQGFVKLGTAQLQSREAAAAERSFGEALKLSTNHVEALTGLGFARLQRGRAAEAAACFNAALDVDPKHVPALLASAIVAQQHLKDRNLALRRYREYLVLRPGDSSVRSVVLSLEQEQQRAGAVRSRVADAASPQLGASISSPGTTKSLQTNAVQPSPALSLKVGSPSAVTNSALWTGSKPATNVGLDQTTPSNHLDDSRVDSKTNSPRKTVLQRLNPANLFRRGGSSTNVNAYYSRVESEPRPGMNHSNGLPRYSYSVLKQPPAGNRPASEQAFAEGVKFQRSNDVIRAVLAYRKAVALDPSYFEPHYYLGVAASETGDLKAAMLAYESALLIRPDSRDARYNFALALKNGNYLLDSIAELERLTRENPAEARAHLALANIYAQEVVNVQKARRHYLRVLEIEPNNPQSAAIRAWVASHP